MRRVEDAWGKGFARYAEAFPDAIRLVAREEAYSQFVRDCEGKDTHPLFEEQAPVQAYLLLCIEHVKHNQYTKEA
jgi:hypothetical protein